jgi:hypothetical protein
MMSFQEIADQLGMSWQGVQASHNRAIAKIAEVFNREGLTFEDFLPPQSRSPEKAIKAAIGRKCDFRDLSIHDVTFESVPLAKRVKMAELQADV